jgi:hypothetical protein
MRVGREHAPPRNSRIQVRNEQKEITHLMEAAADHTRYSDYNCKCVAGNRTPLRPFGRGKIVKTVRLNHLGGALLATAAACLLAAVGLVVLYAQSAEATFPGKPGKIAYSGYDGNDLEIYTINTGGGGKKQVTDNSSIDEWPDYAPGGKRIAYTNSVTGGDDEIYTIKPDGGGRQPVTDNSSDDYYPSYSPSGKKIAYVNSVTGTDTEIWTIQPGGGGRQQVTDNAHNDRDPYWGSQ